MKRYKIQIFFWKEGQPKQQIDIIPSWAKYKEKTKMIEFDSYEDPRNEALRLYPDAAFLIVRGMANIGVVQKKERFISEYDTPILEIRPSKIDGYGVFSKKPIDKDVSIFKLHGKMVSSNEIKGDFPTGEWNAISDTHFLVREKRTIYSYINHSREPNCEIDFASMEVKMIKHVRADQELTLDYRKEALPSSYIETFGAFYL